MIAALIVFMGLVFAFCYATGGVAVYKVRMDRAALIHEGTNCTDCNGGTKRGRGCYHYEHNRNAIAPIKAVAAFWPFVGIALIVARCSVMCARNVARGPSSTGKAIAAVFIGREDKTKGLQDRIAELEAEDARWKDKFERELGTSA